MKIFAAGDLHLSKSQNKPMDIFGEAWKDHDARICTAWREVVSDEDIVLVPGDLSWAMRLEDAYNDLQDIMQLPGKKIFIRGNHDYWWNSIGKLRDMFSSYTNTWFLQNDSVTVDGIAFAGTRGWLCPQSTEFKKEKDAPLYERELLRLEMSLKCMQKGVPRILLLHYPPLVSPELPTGFTHLAEKYDINNIVYGHLHGYSTKQAFTGCLNGIKYDLCSLDHINFKPIEIKLNLR